MVMGAQLWWSSDLVVIERNLKSSSLQPMAYNLSRTNFHRGCAMKHFYDSMMQLPAPEPKCLELLCLLFPSVH